MPDLFDWIRATITTPPPAPRTSRSWPRNVSGLPTGATGDIATLVIDGIRGAAFLVGITLSHQAPNQITNNKPHRPMKNNKYTSLQDVTASILAEKTKIQLAADSYASSLRERQAAFEKFKADPSQLSVTDATAVVSNLATAEKLSEIFDAGMVSQLQIQAELRILTDDADAITATATAELETRLKPRASYIESLTKWFQEISSTIFTKDQSDLERERILTERDKREADAIAIESNIVGARSTIEYFRKNPSPQNFSDIVSALCSVNF